MNITEINQLLEGYFAGTSSVEQETALKNYFSGEYDSSFKEVAPLFAVFNTQAAIKSSVEMPADLNVWAIDRLLEKYWDCTSTLEDESTLKEYFAGPDINEKHIQFADLFRVFNEEKAIVGGELKSDIGEEKPQESKSKVFSISRKWMAVAASLFLAMMVWFNVDDTTSLDVPGVDTSGLTAEEKEAYEVTVEALAFLSGKLDKSSNSIGSDIKKVGNAQIFK
jgi:hypothetical protein